MPSQIAYCAGCDRNVRVVLRPGAVIEEPEVTPDPHDLVCLEVGETCTGSMCPLFDTPADPDDTPHAHPSTGTKEA